jgi:hypothetical protein
MWQSVKTPRYTGMAAFVVQVILRKLLASNQTAYCSGEKRKSKIKQIETCENYVKLKRMKKGVHTG